MENGTRQLTRREREKLKQRQDMLSTALELFSAKGYHNVSMHEIAERSEFAIGTLYKFFRNKEDLYRALVLEKFDLFHDTITKAMEEPGDEVEKLRNFVRVKGQMFRDNVSMIRLYFGEARGASFSFIATLEPEIRERYGRLLQSLASIFEKGIRRKRFRKIADSYALAVALDSLTNGFLSFWLEAPERHPYPEDPDTILNILFKALITP